MLNAFVKSTVDGHVHHQVETLFTAINTKYLLPVSHMLWVKIDRNFISSCNQ